ncbi:high-potential iron-sulfur protein [Rhodoferax sp.]|uniref:high-potential iron-sulfur protein n=1 Tax=Rhodoferax sp. TaxID=50421 RepID=UPI002629837B|nr:high-potential iron-sulfur protein [Rhodoferax sp.]MDD2919376.1 high-potential iron-sulfur protein [Rhodoferax sp.]
MTTRRVFMMQSVLGASALASGVAMAAVPMVAETDANAKGLGYVADSAKADGKKYPKHAATQACNNCALYQGKAGAASGPCPLFAGKEVSAKGWCSAYAKKA